MWHPVPQPCFQHHHPAALLFKIQKGHGCLYLKYSGIPLPFLPCALRRAFTRSANKGTFPFRNPGAVHLIPFPHRDNSPARYRCLLRQPPRFNMEERQADTDPFPLGPGDMNKFQIASAGPIAPSADFLWNQSHDALARPLLQKINAPSISPSSPQSPLSPQNPPASLKSMPASFLPSLHLTPSARRHFCSLGGCSAAARTVSLEAPGKPSANCIGFQHFVKRNQLPYAALSAVSARRPGRFAAPAYSGSGEGIPKPPTESPDPKRFIRAADAASDSGREFLPPKLHCGQPPLGSASHRPPLPGIPPTAPDTVWRCAPWPGIRRQRLQTSKSRHQSSSRPYSSWGASSSPGTMPRPGCRLLPQSVPMGINLQNRHGILPGSPAQDAA